MAQLSFKVSKDIDDVHVYEDMDDVVDQDGNYDERWYFVYPAIRIIEPADFETSLPTDEQKACLNDRAFAWSGTMGLNRISPRVKQNIAPSWTGVSAFTDGSFYGWRKVALRLMGVYA